jgi:mono/diheme cytochrome c family protein
MHKQGMALAMVLLTTTGSAVAQEVTYRGQIAALWQNKCIACHGAQSPERADFLLGVGNGAWNLNRWEPRGDVPAVTKAQMEKIAVKY